MKKVESSFGSSVGEGIGCLLACIGIAIIFAVLAFIGRGGIEWLMTK